MAEARQPPRAARAIPRTGVIPPAPAAFLLLLALAFWASYAVGSAAGPVAPGLHGTRTGAGTGDGTGGGGDDGDGGMENMPGTTHGHGG
ncbi:hypothetical protein B0675_38695 [Streptomyces sp. M41(2017)]|uniref:hypothetical protein n=1 Tax=Streptomyces sp. M41(2017) TaxID=1955065 RepID=UPI0009C121F1|nr:hypothetical protein [Streptomyces sp. M41(2017)]OQQ13487.1 hypothetical protein B0675_38695 [Streptomyces sp. M41(2017)]